MLAFLGLSLFQSFVTIKPIAEKARSKAIELAIVLYILTASWARTS